jgi:WD40 repeat protein
VAPTAGGNTLTAVPSQPRLIPATVLYKQRVPRTSGSHAVQITERWLDERRQSSAQHTGNVLGLAWSPSAPLLATCSDDGMVRLWHLTGGEPRVRTIGPGPFGGAVRSVAFTPDGRYLVTANANGTLYVLRVGDG